MDINSRTLNVPQSFDISKMDIPDIPEDITFPDELNTFLREQIRYYTHENGMVKKNLSDMELKYNECKIKMDNLEIKLKEYEKGSDGSSMLNSTKVASSKIVELSKKLREKNSEVETLKTKISKLEQRIYELKKKSEDTKESVSPKVEKPINELEETIRKLQDKLNSTTNKLLEIRNGNAQLKNDLKIANKWLQQEVGESFESLQSLNNSNVGNWRGRAQIICDLQQKNSELKEKLKDLQDRFGNSKIAALTTKTDNRISTLTKENNELKQSYEELRKKYDAARARFRVLDSDYTILKAKFTLMKEEAERTQDMMSNISTQISISREQKNDVIKLKDEAINNIKMEKDVLSKELNEYKMIIKNIKKELHEKNQELSDIKASEPFSNNCGINDDKTISCLNAERLRLLELVEVQNNRLKMERDAHSKTHQLLRLEKQRCAKAEANAARVQLESTTARSSSYNTMPIRPLDFGLKDQLELAEENIKALKTRLEIEQYERKADFQEFNKILQNYENYKETNV